MSLAERVAIFGVGLIGGSLGMAWRAGGAAAHVVGVGRDAGRLAQAQELGAVDSFTTDPAAGLAGADVVVLAGPVSTILKWARSLASLLPPGAVVTDVGSTKAQVVRTWEAHLPPGCSFVGGHPMAGSEQAGVTAARTDLCRGARYIITPGALASQEAVERISALARAAGAQVLTMTPEEHDARVAYVSHLPQLVATALGATVLAGEERLGRVIGLAGGGFRDTTRIAASPAEMWQDIVASNRERILTALATFRAELAALERAVEVGDAAAIAEVFARGNLSRQILAKGCPVPPAESADQQVG